MDVTIMCQRSNCVYYCEGECQRTVLSIDANGICADFYPEDWVEELKEERF